VAAQSRDSGNGNHPIAAVHESASGTNAKFWNVRFRAAVGVMADINSVAAVPFGTTISSIAIPPAEISINASLLI
jgi:hypothetical protein